MKRTFFLIGYFMLLIIMTISCVGEDYYINNTNTSMNSMKTYELKDFEEALISLGNPENRPMNEITKSTQSIELSEKRQMVLLNPAKQFLIANGMTEDQLNEFSTKEIITLAMEMRTKELNKITLELKSLSLDK